VNYELREAARQASAALHGNPWTGGLDKHAVGRAVRRLISVAEAVERECERLRAEVDRRRSR
jgi:hypothetical protein